MPIYAIGDIQGCGAELESLLARIEFDRDRDELWIAGDLVNRGPRSLHVLRRLYQMDASVRAVLGNHDLHLIGRALAGAPAKGKDTLDEVLEAPDSGELMDWLRHRPLLYRDESIGWTMVHAALHPDWDLEEAERRATLVGQVLRGPEGPALAASLSQGEIPTIEPDPADEETWLRFNAAVLTRTRFCTADGEFAWGGDTPADARFGPWYSHFHRRSRHHWVVYGHWAADGFTRNEDSLGLDSGCVWGGALTAAQLYPGPVDVWQVACPGYRTPKG